jgi:hypothetical protein
LQARRLASGVVVVRCHASSTTHDARRTHQTTTPRDCQIAGTSPTATRFAATAAAWKRAPSTTTKVVGRVTMQRPRGQSAAKSCVVGLLLLWAAHTHMDAVHRLDGSRRFTHTHTHTLTNEVKHHFVKSLKI